MEQNKTRNRIYAAKFDAERYWQPEHIVMLPAIRNSSLDNIVCAMDELMFGLCQNQEDVVLTGLPMNPAHLAYLHKIGFQFTNQYFEEEMKGKSCEYHAENYKLHDISQNAVLETYAILPEYEVMSEQNHMYYPHPEQDVVANVNSKIYSTELSQKLGFSQYAKIVRDEAAFLQEGKRILQENGGLIIKEEYGVSGKGNLKITEEKAFQTVCRNIAMQCKKGKEIRFILEPAFQVVKDFSVQYDIHRDTGKAERISVQQILNQERAYHGSVTADEELLLLLEQRGYFKTMEQVMAQLYEDGYFGDVCVDSMIVEPDMLVPVVEINARKSMSLIKKSLENRLIQLDYDNEEICTFYIDTIVHPKLCMEEVLRRMQEAKLLFTVDLRKGVIPLTSNTLFVNLRKNPEKNQKGRLYFLLAGTRTEVAQYREKVTGLCKTFAEG